MANLHNTATTSCLVILYGMVYLTHAVVEPPTDVRVDLTSSSLLVTWTPPARGKVLGYQLFYTPSSVAESTDPSLWYHIEVWGTGNAASVEGILPGLHYAVTLKTLGRGYEESDFSEIVHTYSEDEEDTGPGHSVEDLRVLGTTTTSISVIWEPPSGDGVAIAYQVLYYPIDNPLAAEFYITPVPIFALDFLQENTAYYVAVTPHFERGYWGETVSMYAYTD